MIALTRPSALIPAAEVGEARVPQHWMGPVLQLFLRAGEAMAAAAKAATMMTVILENIFEFGTCSLGYAAAKTSGIRYEGCFDWCLESIQLCLYRSADAFLQRAS